MSATDSLAINGYNWSPYDYQFFAQAWNTPNINNPSFQGAQNTQNTAQTTNTAQGSILTQQNTPASSKEEEKGTNWGAIATGVAAVGAAALCIYAHGKGKGSGIIEKTTDGLKQIWNGFKGKAGKIINKGTTEFSVTKGANGETLCTIPNRTNIMKTPDAAQKLTEIGAKVDAPTLTNTTGIPLLNPKTTFAQGVKLREGTYIDGPMELTFKKGKVTSYKINGQDMLAKYRNPVEPTEIKNKETIDKLLSSFNRGEKLDKLTNVRYSHKENGVSRMFHCDRGVENPTLEFAVSNKFNASSDVVKAYGADNPKVADALKSFAEGKTDGLKILEADYVSPSFGTFHIKNGEITGLTEGGVFHAKDSDRFKALYSENKEAFDNVLKNEDGFTNIVRVLA